MGYPLAIFSYKKWLAIIYLVLGIDLLLTNHYLLGPLLIILSVFFIEFNFKHFEHTFRNLFKVYLSKKMRKSIGLHDSIHIIGISVSLMPLIYLFSIPNILQIFSLINVITLARLFFFMLIYVNLLYYTVINLAIYANVHNLLNKKRTRVYHRIIKSNGL